MERKDLNELPPAPKSPFRASLEKKEAEFEASHQMFAHSPVPDGDRTPGGYTPFGMRRLHNDDEAIIGIASPTSGSKGTMMDDVEENSVAAQGTPFGSHEKERGAGVQVESEIETKTQDYNSELVKLLEKSRGTPYEATLKRFIEEKALNKESGRAGTELGGLELDTDVGKSGTSIFRSPRNKGKANVNGDHKAPSSPTKRTAFAAPAPGSPSRRSAEADVREMAAQRSDLVKNYKINRAKQESVHRTKQTSDSHQEWLSRLSTPYERHTRAHELQHRLNNRVMRNSTNHIGRQRVGLSTPQTEAFSVFGSVDTQSVGKSANALIHTSNTNNKAYNPHAVFSGSKKMFDLKTRKTSGSQFKSWLDDNKRWRESIKYKKADTAREEQHSHTPNIWGRTDMNATNYSNSNQSSYGAHRNLALKSLARQAVQLAGLVGAAPTSESDSESEGEGDDEVDEESGRGRGSGIKNGDDGKRRRADLPPPPLSPLPGDEQERDSLYRPPSATRATSSGLPPPPTERIPGQNSVRGSGDRGRGRSDENEEEEEEEEEDFEFDVSDDENDRIQRDIYEYVQGAGPGPEGGGDEENRGRSRGSGRSRGRGRTRARADQTFRRAASANVFDRMAARIEAYTVHATTPATAAEDRVGGKYVGSVGGKTRARSADSNRHSQQPGAETSTLSTADAASDRAKDSSPSNSHSQNFHFKDVGDGIDRPSKLHSYAASEYISHRRRRWDPPVYSHEDAKHCTFSPSINRRSDELVRRRRERARSAEPYSNTGERGREGLTSPSRVQGKEDIGEMVRRLGSSILHKGTPGSPLHKKSVKASINNLFSSPSAPKLRPTSTYRGKVYDNPEFCAPPVAEQTTTTSAIREREGRKARRSASRERTRSSSPAARARSPFGVRSVGTNYVLDTDTISQGADRGIRHDQEWGLLPGKVCVKGGRYYNAAMSSADRLSQFYALRDGTADTMAIPCQGEAGKEIPGEIPNFYHSPSPDGMPSALRSPFLNQNNQNNQSQTRQFSYSPGLGNASVSGARSMGRGLGGASVAGTAMTSGTKQVKNQRYIDQHQNKNDAIFDRSKQGNKTFEQRTDESVEEFVLKRGIADVMLLNGVQPSPGTYHVSVDTKERFQASNYRTTSNSSTFFQQTKDAVGSSTKSGADLVAKNGPELQCKNANGGEEDGRGNVYTGRAGYTFSHKPRNFAQYGHVKVRGIARKLVDKVWEDSQQNMEGGKLGSYYDKEGNLADQ